jgi:hypothetical protein
MIDRIFRRHRRWHDLLTDVVSGRASPGRREAFERHLAACDACRTRFEGQQAIHAALGGLPLLEPSRSLRLTPAMLEPSRRPAPSPLPAPLVLAVRGIAAAAVALFAAVAVLMLADTPDRDTVSTAPAEGPAGAGLMSTEAADGAPVAPLAVPSPEPTSTAGVAAPPNGGASGAAATAPVGVTPAPQPAAAGAASPQDASASPAPGERAAGPPAPKAVGDGEGPAAAARSETGEARWPLYAAGAVAALALAALAGVELLRRRRTP